MIDRTPPPVLQPYDPTRGLISCFTSHGLESDDDTSVATAVALHDLLLDLYDEAFRRLPVQDMPGGVDMAQLVHRGGLCLGLLDPVTNIVLNTVSLLPHGFEFDTNPSRPSAAFGYSSFGFRVPPSRRRRETSRESWRAVASRSSTCLLEFMRAYFGLLTQEQAARYLVWARADLALAVLLVEHDLYAARPAAPDPRSGRTRNSLRIAATHGNHASPDNLVSLATAWLPSERLEMVAPVLRRRNRLTVHDVNTILHVLRHQDDMSTMPASPTGEEAVGPVVERTRTLLADGRIAYTTVIQRAGDYIASLRRSQDMDSTLSSYSTATHAVPGTAKWPPQDSPCAFVRSFDANADSCPYTRSLQMSLCGAIHGFYLRALAILPSHSGRNHVRGILLAGHCYGPMDPVSNILLSAVWYDVNYPLPYADRHTQAHDILDTLTMLRAVYRSLRGLVALLHTTSGQQLPLHEILKYLCYTQCDIAAMIQPHLNDKSSPNPLMAAATAAQHPKAASIATFYASMAPTKLDQLRSLMMSATANNAPLSHESLTLIYNLVREETSSTIMPWLRPPKLCKTALSILTRKRKDYAQQQSFIHGRIKQLLQDYAVCHPSEPKYDLDFVCGLTKAGHMDQCYHVNFMAATKSTCKNTLFFAEFRLAYGDQSKSSICCPLPQPYDMGRCYYGQESARNITYPDHSMDIFSSDITRGGLNDIEDILDTDFIYFDSQRDVVVARVLQKNAKQEEVMQRSSRKAR